MAQIDAQILEDIIYTGIVRGFNIHLSNARIKVTPNKKQNSFDIHFCFPMVGSAGLSLDKIIFTDELQGKSVEEFVDVLKDLYEEILVDVNDCIEEEQD